MESTWLHTSTSLLPERLPDTDACSKVRLMLYQIKQNTNFNRKMQFVSGDTAPSNAAPREKRNRTTPIPCGIQ